MGVDDVQIPIMGNHEERAPTPVLCQQ